MDSAEGGGACGVQAHRRPSQAVGEADAPGRHAEAAASGFVGVANTREVTICLDRVVPERERGQHGDVGVRGGAVETRSQHLSSVLQT